MSLLVTGGTGFIGSRLVERLRAEGRDVRCLARASSSTEVLERLGARIVVADLVRGEGLAKALRGVKLVIHLAGVVRSWSSREYFRVNVDGTRNLAEEAVRAGVERFVLVSSLAAAGPCQKGTVLSEAASPRPVGPYGESKLAAERALAACAPQLVWSVVRPSVVYGPGDRDVLQLFRLARRRIVPYAAPRGARLSLVHVDDLVELIVRCLEKAPRRSVYFGSDGQPYEWREVILSIGRGMGREVRPVRVPPMLLWPAALLVEALRLFTRRPPVFCLQKLREAIQPSWACSPGRARRDLGFEPRMALDDGVTMTARWYTEAGWL